MQKIRWSLVMLVLLAPLSIGCGNSEPSVVGSQEELEQFAADNPDEEVVEDTADPVDAGN